MKLCCWITLTSLFLSTQAHASVVNGLFLDDFNGYNVKAEANRPQNNPSDTTPFVNIQNNANDPYAQLLTDEDVGSFVKFLTIEQQFTVTAQNSLLSFDYGLILDTENSGLGNNFIPSDNSDLFSVLIRDLDAAGTISDLGVYNLIDVTTAAPISNPSSTNVTDPSNANSPVLAVTTQAAADPFFETSASVDLSALEGRDLEIEFILRDFFDGRRTAYGVDNIVLSQSPSLQAIPLPASMSLMIFGFAAFGFARRLS